MLQGNSTFDNNNNPTYVSIHVRRTDYENHLKVLSNMQPVSITYFFDAMKYFRDNYKVIISIWNCNLSGGIIL